MTCTYIVEESNGGEKLVGGYWVMWMTKLRVVVIKIVRRPSYEDSPYKENIVLSHKININLI